MESRTSPSRLRLILEGQGLHVAALALLILGLILASELDLVRAGALWGLESVKWFWIAALVAILHQHYVWFCWRTELHGALLSRLFGSRGFTLFATGFALLGLTRVVAVFALAVSNRGTVPSADAVLQALALVALVPAVYLFYSVQRYFGFRRAFGIDHFDPAYRRMPFVREGIFRFSDNAMYTFGFLILWVPALWFGSVAGLCIALFNHIYIWVHYASTERPDMRRIYGGNPGRVQ